MNIDCCACGIARVDCEYHRPPTPNKYEMSFEIPSDFFRIYAEAYAKQVEKLYAEMYRATQMFLGPTEPKK